MYDFENQIQNENKHQTDMDNRNASYAQRTSCKYDQHLLFLQNETQQHKDNWAHQLQPKLIREKLEHTSAKTLKLPGLTLLHSLTVKLRWRT